MPSAETHDDERIVVQTEYRDRHLIKQVPGSRYDSTDHVWHVPLSWGACVTLRGLFGDRLEVGPRLTRWSWAEYQLRVQPAVELREALEPLTDHDHDLDLRPFQRAGVDFLVTAQRALLADPMGSGKTVQVIRALRQLHDGDPGGEPVFPVLVVCPNSVKAVWRDEFARWWPEVVVQVVGGPANVRRQQLKAPADVYVLNWESVRLHSRLAGYGDQRLTDDEKVPKELNEVCWRAVVADEAHRMKDPRAKQTRAVWAVGHTALFRFALTGTPIANAPDELWPILHLLDEREWPAKTKFVDRWCESSFNAFGGLSVIGLKAATRDEFFRIVDPRLRRLPKDLLLPQLPEKVYQQRDVDMGTKQARAYAQMEEHMIAKLDDELLVAPNPLSQLTRLVQFACAYAELDAHGDVRLSEPSNKVDALEELLDELGPDEPVVVFAVSKQLVNLAAARLQKRGHEVGLITGDQSPDERATTVERFQAGKLRAVLCTIAAGGVGLTLTRARVAVFLQRSWSAVDNAQAEDRVHRIGSEQHDTIEVIDVISPGTVEERVRLVLGEKHERLEEVVRDRTTLLRLLGRT